MRRVDAVEFWEGFINGVSCSMSGSSSDSASDSSDSIRAGSTSSGSGLSGRAPPLRPEKTARRMMGWWGSMSRVSSVGS